jgi:glycosyltransferase involved in cell wall biosynthesis
VKARTGWFSCRSACYLAAGRPVVTQDTGWSAHLPTGRGLFAFDTLEEAAAALREVEAAPAAHSRAARELAEEHFDGRRVLGRLLDEIS